MAQTAIHLLLFLLPLPLQNALGQTGEGKMTLASNSMERKKKAVEHQSRREIILYDTLKKEENSASGYA